MKNINRKNLKLGVISTMLTVSAGSAFAEGSGAHGGGAFVCRDANGTVLKANLWDTRIGELNRKFPTTYKNSYEDENKVIEFARNRLQTLGAVSFLKEFDRELGIVNSAWNPVPQKPTPAGDADLPIQGNVGCKPEYIVNYNIRNGQTILWANDDVVNAPNSAFSMLDKGGIKIHEAVFAVTRGSLFKQTSSVLAQDIVSLLLSDTLTIAETSRLFELTKEFGETSGSDSSDLIYGYKHLTLLKGAVHPCTTYDRGKKDEFVIDSHLMNFYGRFYTPDKSTMCVNDGDQFTVISSRSDFSYYREFVLVRVSDGKTFIMGMPEMQTLEAFRAIFDLN